MIPGDGDVMKDSANPRLRLTDDPQEIIAFLFERSAVDVVNFSDRLRCMQQIDLDRIAERERGF